MAKSQFVYFETFEGYLLKQAKSVSREKFISLERFSLNEPTLMNL